MLTIESRTLRRFSIEEYLLILELGIIGPGERTELCLGSIVHLGDDPAQDRLTAQLARALSHETQDTLVRPRGRLQLGDSLLVPEVTVVPFVFGLEPTDAVPVADVRLIVEVVARDASNTAIGYERLRKAPLYASAAVPELWLVDADAHLIEVHTEPADGAYRSVTRVGLGNVVRPTSVASVPIAVSDLLGL